MGSSLKKIHFASSFINEVHCFENNITNIDIIEYTSSNLKTRPTPFANRRKRFDSNNSGFSNLFFPLTKKCFVFFVMIIGTVSKIIVFRAMNIIRAFRSIYLTRRLLPGMNSGFWFKRYFNLPSHTYIF